MMDEPAPEKKVTSRSSKNMEILIIVSFLAVCLAYQSFTVLNASMSLFNPITSAWEINMSAWEINISAFLDVNASEGDGVVGADRSKPTNQVNHNVWDRIPTPEASNFYEQFRRKNATIVVDNEVHPQPEVVFRGVSGLGHNLFRQSGVFHTARLMKFPHMSASWGWECGMNEEGHPDIFDNLFGFGPMTTEPEANARGAVEGRPEIVTQPKEFGNIPRLNLYEKTRIVNYVGGYRFFSVCPFSLTRKMKMNDVYEKTITDEQFFRQLRTLFRFNDRVRNFTEHHSFSKRIVLGVHIRTGNGETGDFSIKKRGFHDIDDWIQNASASLARLAIDMAQSRSVSLPPLVFVATDDVSVLDKVANATKVHGMEVVSFPQRYLEEGAGVTYKSAAKGDACHESWISQLIDAILLGASDAVLAARYSSFAQSIPLFTVLADSIYKERPPGFDPGNLSTYFFNKTVDDDAKKYSNRLFCESNILGDAFDCYDDYFQWLLGDTAGRERIQIVGNQTLHMAYSKENYVSC